MRVGIFDPYLDDIGGGERYMMSIAEYLSNIHHVVIFWDHRSDVKKIQEQFSLELSRVSKIFFNSEYSRSFVNAGIAQKGVVLSPPVPLNAKAMKKENIILHVGRFRARNLGTTDYKKQDFMVATLKKMVDRGFKDWKFVLAVGVHDEDKENFNRVQEAAKGYPIEFLINMNNKKLWEVYSKAKLYWH